MLRDRIQNEDKQLNLGVQDMAKIKDNHWSMCSDNHKMLLFRDLELDKQWLLTKWRETPMMTWMEQVTKHKAELERCSVE